ncbi:hypothetical protein CANCADRAFT_32806 [Tortispora caseinolytica NRRL Y-17796]|uniref:ATP synthase subunit gamma n=1 Tax=Tortispora caseinolytica NRRL Y-17796 TaxID=767744 RepID=A0A1E4TCW2_9ASCO|nr:hypothetical protein CANCADRAFT_32806 [Tortispora caseinolytica NRRL Y-17796]
MKIVASTRLNKAQRAMAESRVYGQTSEEIYKQAETTAAPATEDSAVGKRLVVVASSDKGLCGGVHSQLSKKVRQMQAESPEHFDIVVLGEKAKAKLSSVLGNDIVLSFSNVGKDIPTFAESLAIADEISKLDTDYAQTSVVYNGFKSALSFEPTVADAYNETSILASKELSQYEIEDDVLRNLAEFSLANVIHWGLVEGHACEIQARRSAMDNASNNASDMIGSYSILYNRTRQAVITNELVDIITGASSLE